MRWGAKINEKAQRKVLEHLLPALIPGEQVMALVKTDKLAPLLQFAAVTNARIVGFSTTAARGAGFPEQVRLPDVRNIHAEKTFSGTRLIIFTDVAAHDFGVLVGDREADYHLVGQTFMSVRDSPLPLPEGVLSGPSPADGNPVAAQTVVVGTAPKEKAARALQQNLAPSEHPWLIINSPAAGMLAACEDRLFIIKVGGVTSWGAGATGGGRTATFMYMDITGIEYNSGWVNGVLEILTASYSGAGNHDYWRGFGKSVNANTGNPFTLSNTLPLGKDLYDRAAPHLVALRQRIGQVKRPGNVQVTPPAAAPHPAQSSLVEEITKLAALHADGILSDEEFSAAKAATIARFT